MSNCESATCCTHESDVGIVNREGERHALCFECGHEWPVSEVPDLLGDVNKKVTAATPCGSDYTKSDIPNPWGGPL